MQNMYGMVFKILGHFVHSSGKGAFFQSKNIVFFFSYFSTKHMVWYSLEVPH